MYTSYTCDSGHVDIGKNTPAQQEQKTDKPVTQLIPSPYSGL